MRLKLARGEEELYSTGGNYLCGQRLDELPPERTQGFVGRCVAGLGKLGLNGQCLLRLDSGNDAEENFQHFGDNFFIVKRNLRRECPEQWLATARRV